MSQTSVGHRPTESRWTFDQSVVACFDDMVERSIPIYADTIDVCSRLAMRHRPAIDDNRPMRVADLGCATGNTLARFVQVATKRSPDLKIEMLGIDCESAMLEQAASKLAPVAEANDRLRFRFKSVDLRDFDPLVQVEYAHDAIFLMWTAQFIPLERRAQLIRGCRRMLADGGALFIAEKVRGQTAAFEDVLSTMYHAHKVARGYSPMDVAEKAAALEGVLVPLSAPENKQLFAAEGFHVEEVIRYLNFAAWYCLPK